MQRAINDGATATAGGMAVVWSGTVEPVISAAILLGTLALVGLRVALAVREWRTGVKAKAAE
jgi:hypothetical protein